jgi:hypothetical protein
VCVGRVHQSHLPVVKKGNNSLLSEGLCHCCCKMLTCVCGWLLCVGREEYLSQKRNVSPIRRPHAIAACMLQMLTLCGCSCVRGVGSTSEPPDHQKGNRSGDHAIAAFAANADVCAGYLVCVGRRPQSLLSRRRGNRSLLSGPCHLLPQLQMLTAVCRCSCVRRSVHQNPQS